MRTHEDAIASLKHHGVIATRRVWSLGDTVEVPLGKFTVDDSGIHSAADVAWLVPAAGPCWDVVQIVLSHERAQRFPSLTDAVNAVLVLQDLHAQRDRCPSCGGTRELEIPRFRGHP